jgi:hypothetical protein
MAGFCIVFLIGFCHDYHTIRWLHDYMSRESQPSDAHFNTVQ